MSRQITREQAEGLIDQYRHLQAKVHRGPKDPNDEELDKINVFIQRDKNAFVFDREDIERFFEKGATHLLVMHGAHANAEIDKGVKKGSYTVLTIGCKQEKVGENLKFKAVDTIKPATQYPEKLALVDIPENLESDSQDTIYFTFD
jgi:hypothetical protein